MIIPISETMIDSDLNIKAKNPHWHEGFLRN
jgi:hypothetical protein